MHDIFLLITYIFILPIQYRRYRTCLVTTVRAQHLSVISICFGYGMVHPTRYNCTNVQVKLCHSLRAHITGGPNGLILRVPMAPFHAPGPHASCPKSPCTHFHASMRPGGCTWGHAMGTVANCSGTMCKTICNLEKQNLLWQFLHMHSQSACNKLALMLPNKLLLFSSAGARPCGLLSHLSHQDAHTYLPFLSPPTNQLPPVHTLATPRR